MNDHNFIRCSECGSFMPDEVKSYAVCVHCLAPTTCYRCGLCHYCEHQNDVNCLIRADFVDSSRQGHEENSDFAPF